MRHAFRLCLALLCLTLASAACGNPPSPARHGTHPAVLLISIDAFRADYLHRGHTPTLAMLSTQGVHAAAMKPAFPSLTFPNHYTLVTGLYPDHHGIVNNTMYDPRLGRFSLGNRTAVADGRWWSEGEPIWVTADRAGLKTATMFWPGSGTRIHGRRPDHWRAYNGKWTPTRRVDQVLKWLDLPPAQRPDFLTLYFDRVDHAGHRYGPDTPQVNAAMHRIDNALAHLVTGLKKRHLFHHMNIIVVSDHGMASTPAGQVIRMNRLIDLKHVRVVTLGIVAGFIPKPQYADEIAAKLLRPHPHMHCYRRADFPKRYHYGSNPRVPPLDYVADVGWQISSKTALDHRSYPMALGEHGYDNDAPTMRALFIAHGPAFRRGLTVPEFPNVDVYPLMAHLLHIKPQANDGDYATMKDMLKPDAR